MAGGATLRRRSFRYLMVREHRKSSKRKAGQHRPGGHRIQSARPPLGDLTVVILAKRKPSSTFCQRALHRSRRSQPVASVLRIHSGATPSGCIHPTSQPQADPSKPDISTLQRIGHFYFALTGLELSDWSSSVAGQPGIAFSGGLRVTTEPQNS